MVETSSLKLAVILHADVVGSTDLVRLDEAVADRRMNDAFKRFSQAIARHHGIAHEVRGDALVAEFSKASDALAASLAFQAENTSHNEELPDEIRPVVRVGIALGEVVVNENRMSGEGVALAQRLEQLAAPEGVCVQGAAYETVPTRLPFRFRDCGERELKGFVNPIRVYAVDTLEPNTPESEHHTPGRAGSSVPPERATIAVLAFTNMSADPEQEFFCDGITEDIITELSRFPVLSVVSRHSSFSFKGESVDIKEVGKRLGADYVVEGSVRRAGGQVRVTAQLIETATDSHVWAERYVRELEDIFAVQDDVTRAIVATVAVKLGKSVSERAARKAPTDIESYEYLLQANQHYYRFNADDNVAAARLYGKAIDCDPGFARAYSGLANCYGTDYFMDWRRRQDSLRSCREYAQKAIELDSGDQLARIMLAWSLIGEHQWEQAQLELERIVAAKPGDADVLAEAGHALWKVGRLEEGIRFLEEAIRLNPLFPDPYRRWLGQAYYLAGRYEDAVATLRSTRLQGWDFGWLAAALARIGESDQAKEAIGTFATRYLEPRRAGTGDSPDSSVVESLLDYFRYDEDWEHFLGGLRLAGLSE